MLLGQSVRAGGAWSPPQQGASDDMVIDQSPPNNPSSRALVTQTLTVGTPIKLAPSAAAFKKPGTPMAVCTRFNLLPGIPLNAIAAVSCTSRPWRYVGKSAVDTQSKQERVRTGFRPDIWLVKRVKSLQTIYIYFTM
jgi:hypothetical protein